MARVPPDQLHPIARVFRLHPNGRDLSEIPHSVWLQIADHHRPLQPANGSVKVLMISGRGDICESVDALRLQTDNFGFLMTWHASTHLHKQASNVVEARHRFLRRYIAHRHSWQPAPALLAQALHLAGFEQNS